MAQDKSAEIIKFNSPGEPPESEAAPQAEQEAAMAADAPAPSLEEAGAGAFLSAARHRAKLTIEQVSEATKVKAEHLEAIEWMRLDRLPALPYASGFVKAYARYLGLDADAVAAQFKRQAGALAAAVETSPAPAKPDHSSGEGAKLGSVFALLAVALFVLWIGYQVLTGGGRGAEIAQTEAPATSPTANTEPQTLAIAPAPGPQSETPPLAQEAATETLALDDFTATETPPATNAIAEAASAETQTPDAPVIEPETIEAPSLAEEAPALAESAPEQTAPAQTEQRERPLPRRARPEPEPARAPVIVEAQLTRSTAPDYPNGCARGAGAMESVTIVFDVSAAGRAVNARVASSTNNCFEDEALRTVARWRFDPRTADGRAVAESGKRATLNFRQ